MASVRAMTLLDARCQSNNMPQRLRKIREKSDNHTPHYQLPYRSGQKMTPLLLLGVLGASGFHGLLNVRHLDCANVCWTYYYKNQLILLEIDTDLV